MCGVCIKLRLYCVYYMYNIICVNVCVCVIISLAVCQSLVQCACQLQLLELATAMVTSSLCRAFFGELALWGDFPIQSSTWRLRPGQLAQAARPKCTENAQFVNVSEVDNGGVQ